MLRRHSLIGLEQSTTTQSDGSATQVGAAARIALTARSAAATSEALNVSFRL